MQAAGTYGWIFLLVLLDQIGAPLPAALTLIYAGMQVRVGRLAWPAVVAVTLVASLVGHGVWYALGRRMGVRVLRRMCRLSPEPDHCVERVERLFARWGPVGLVMARFVPGVDILAQPLAAIIGMRPGRWLALTVSGGVAWSATLMGLGWAFGEHIIGTFTPAAKAFLAVYLLPVLAATMLLVIALVVAKRYRSILGLDVVRIRPAELKTRLDAGEPFLVFDLRSMLQIRLAPYSLPGAQRFTRAALDAARAGPGPTPTVILFCNCLHEIASARLALALAREGIDRCFPLDGGLDAWVRLEYPLAPPPGAASPPTAPARPAVGR